MICADEKTQAFSPVEEQDLADHIDSVYIQGHMPINGADVRRLAIEKYTSAHPRHLRSSRPAFRASNGWLLNFKRRQQFSTRSAAHKRVATTVVTGDDILDFLLHIQETVERIGPSRVFNMDETAWWMINLTKTTWARRGADSAPVLHRGNEKEKISIANTVSAAGDKLTPIVIKKGTSDVCVRHLHLPPSVIGLHTPNGWCDWTVMHKVIGLVSTFVHNQEAMLVVDSYGAHRTEKVDKYARHNNVEMFFVPAGMTSEYQPLDVSVHGPLKTMARSAWRQRALSDPHSKPTMADSVQSFAAAWSHITAETIRSGFRKAGWI